MLSRQLLSWSEWKKSQGKSSLGLLALAIVFVAAAFFVADFFSFLAPINQQVEETDTISLDPAAKKKNELYKNVVEAHRQTLGAFVVDIDIRVTMERGPIVEKLFRQSSIEYDQEGRWHLVQKDPLQQRRWEIFSLGKSRRKLYLRKNNEPFEFAADPIELSRWLDTALLDFYYLVENYRSELLAAGEANGVGESQTLNGLAARCHVWREGVEDANQKQVDLCVGEQSGVIFKGRIFDKVIQQANDYPLTKTIEATMTLKAYGESVKPVVAPSLESLAG